MSIMKSSCPHVLTPGADFTYRPIGRSSRRINPFIPISFLASFALLTIFLVHYHGSLSILNNEVLFPEIYSRQGPSRDYNLADPTAKYGMTPVTFQQIHDATLEKDDRPDYWVQDTSGYSQVWYDPENLSHRKTAKKLRELGVDRDHALRHGWDWPEVGGSFVRDQARTGTCWQLSATTVAEFAFWIAGNAMTNLAPQVLGDCVAIECVGELCNDEKNAPVNVSVSDQVKACMYGDCNFSGFDNYEFCDPVSDDFPARGCAWRNGWGGGSPIDAFRYYFHAGFVEEKEYPFRHCADHDWEFRHRDLTDDQLKTECLSQHRYCYWDREQVYPFSRCMLGLPSSLPCKHKKARKVVGRLSGSFLVSGDSDEIYHEGNAPAILLDEERMKQALVDVGPLSISISSGPMHNYQSGIMDLPAEICPKAEGDHAVTIVGFGTEDGVDYWRIQNSWSDNFGDGGFVRIRRGKNICALASSVQTAWV